MCHASPRLFRFGRSTHRGLFFLFSADGTGIPQFRWLRRPGHLQLHDGILTIALQPAAQQKNNATRFWLLKYFVAGLLNQIFSRGTWFKIKLGYKMSTLGFQWLSLVFSFWCGFERHRFFEVFVLHFGTWLQAWPRLRVLPPCRRDEASERPAAQNTAWCAEGSHLGPAAAIGCGKARTTGDLVN